jgi:hypothetical protein
MVSSLHGKQIKISSAELLKLNMSQKQLQVPMKLSHQTLLISMNKLANQMDIVQSITSLFHFPTNKLVVDQKETSVSKFQFPGLLIMTLISTYLQVWISEAFGLIINLPGKTKPISGGLITGVTVMLEKSKELSLPEDTF